MGNKYYDIEREGQIDFFDNYGIPYNDDNSVLIDNTDGVYNGNIFEFKTNISNTGKVLFQAIRYLSKMRIKGESVPRTILLIDLNNTKVYVYHSDDYKDDIQKVYIGAASKGNEAFSKNVTPTQTLNYSLMTDSAILKKLLKGKKSLAEMYLPIDIDEDCIVGWGERFYRENPNASKGDFIGDDTGIQVKITGEIREPKAFKELINPYTGKTNERFKYLMDCLNDRLSKKDLGAFYTPIAYAKKAAELVMKAVERVPVGNDYIILDRCAGTGNLEEALKGLKDRNNDELISHCVVSTYEYYEYKVLQERIGEEVREIIPPTEADVDYQQGKVGNADAMSEEYINNPLIKQYINDPKCTIILYENPPYHNSSSSTFTIDGSTKKMKTKRKDSFVGKEFRIKGLPLCNVKNTAANDLSNLFIWSGFEYYLRQETDSYIVFAPVGYFKSVRFVCRKFEHGFAFNRQHFHASASTISCVLWSNIEDNDTNSYNLKIYDIDECDKIVDCHHSINVKKVSGPLAVYYDKRVFPDDIEGASVCSADGTEKIGWIGSNKKQAIYHKNILAYIVSKSWALGAMNYSLTRIPYSTELESSHGYYLRNDVYLKKLPVFCAKFYPQEKWYERDVYATTSDGGESYTKDKLLLKECLIYTCLSNQNKCLTFDGSDGRFYRNELCFDTTNGDTVASIDLEKFMSDKKTILDEEEQMLLSIWWNILIESKKTINYNSEFTYGVYQITKELNTFHQEGSGKNKKNIYDYPILNGYLVSLKDNLKTYYKSHIVDKLFLYELLK